jgi:hypothetical protein
VSQVAKFVASTLSSFEVMGDIRTFNSFEHSEFLLMLEGIRKLIERLDPNA